MDNLSKIKKFSKNLHLFLSFLVVAIPLYYVFYWLLVNYLPESLINVNIHPTPLIPHELPIKLQILGFLISLFPLSALIYVIINVRKLFSFYKKGMIFSFEHVSLFKKTAKGLVLWVLLSIFYESAKSVIFSSGNPPGSRVLKVGLSSAEITTLILGGMVLIIAWVMDEGRILNEEKELTV